MESKNRKRQTQKVVDWFLENYDDPVNHCPYDEGDYVWIYGGPYDAREEIEAHFPDMPDEIKEQAVYLKVTNTMATFMCEVGVANGPANRLTSGINRR